MTKNIKKSLLALFTVILTITLAACSTTTKNLTSEEAFNKTAEQVNSIKSMDFTSSIKLEAISNDNTNTTSVEAKGTIVSDPYALKVESTTKNNSNNIDTTIYIKDNTAYVKAPSGEWVKYASSNMLDQFKQLNTLEAMKKDIDVYKNIASNLKIDKDGDNYVLTYNGNDEQFKDLILSILNNSVSNQETTKDELNQFNFKNIEIKYVVSKDGTPISTDVNFTLTNKNNEAQSVKISQNITYSNINKTTSIDIPEEATKNARELRTN